MKFPFQKSAIQKKNGIWRSKLKEFKIQWERGKDNLADYQTKHFPPSYHKEIRPTYILKGYNVQTQSYVRGCVNHPPRGYHMEKPNQFTEPLGRRLQDTRKNQRAVIAPVNTGFKYSSHKIQIKMNSNSNNICQLLFKNKPMTIIEPMTINAQDINK